MRAFPLVSLFAVILAGCSGDVENPDDDGHDDEQEVITTVELTFTPTGGGSDLVFAWADPEDDGDPVIDDIVLDDAEDYTLSVAFLNELEDPAEDITEEVADEAEEHQVFVTGTGVEGPATGVNASAVVTHSYSDSDANGDPIGLDNNVVTIGPGSGDFTVTLRHLPEEDGSPTKTSGLADDVASGGLSSIAGDNDADVTFSVTVQ